MKNNKLAIKCILICFILYILTVSGVLLYFKFEAAGVNKYTEISANEDITTDTICTILSECIDHAQLENIKFNDSCLQNIVTKEQLSEENTKKILELVSNTNTEAPLYNISLVYFKYSMRLQVRIEDPVNLKGERFEYAIKTKGNNITYTQIASEEYTYSVVKENE